MGVAYVCVWSSALRVSQARVKGQNGVPGHPSSLTGGWCRAVLRPAGLQLGAAAGGQRHACMHGSMLVREERREKQAVAKHC